MSAPTRALDWPAVSARLALSNGPCTTADLAGALGVPADDPNLSGELAYAEYRGFVDYEDGAWVLVREVAR